MNVNQTIRRGNAIVLIIIVLALVLAAGIGIALVVVDGKKEDTLNATHATALQRDALLQPIAMWAARAITTSASDGLPDNVAGNALIANAPDKPVVEEANDFTATPVYRKLSATLFQIVLPTSELGGSAHLAYPFNANGDALAPVPGNVFLQESDNVHDPLEEEASPGVGN